MILLIIFSIGLSFLLGVNVGIRGYNAAVSYWEQKLPYQLVLKGLQNSLSSLNIWWAGERFSKMWKIWQLLNENYFDEEKVVWDKMYESALKGFVDAIGDPYTVYFTPQENESFHEALKGTKDFEGIWAVVSKKKDGVLIEEVIKNAPAYKAGLKPLDLILEINWESTADMDLGEAVKKIRGPKGTEVELTIFRESENRVFKVKVVRDKIVVPSVLARVEDLSWTKVGYIDISIIGEDTFDKFKEAVLDLKLKGVKGIILDLRWNGGGFLETAVEIISFFVPQWEKVLTTKYRTFPNQTFYSKGYKYLEWYPVVVLVDGLTASASEIIAGALRQLIGAKLVGTQTFGKGSIQTFTPNNYFGDNSSLKYTIGKWYLPDGHNIDWTGLKVDIEVPFDFTWFVQSWVDLQLQRAQQEILKMIK